MVKNHNSGTADPGEADRLLRRVTWVAVAVAATLVAVGAIELVRRLGNIESGAAMGVIFTAMFAGGVLLLEQSKAWSSTLWWGTSVGGNFVVESRHCGVERNDSRLVQRAPACAFQQNIEFSGSRLD